MHRATVTAPLACRSCKHTHPSIRMRTYTHISARKKFEVPCQVLLHTRRGLYQRTKAHSWYVCKRGTVKLKSDDLEPSRFTDHSPCPRLISSFQLTNINLSHALPPPCAFPSHSQRAYMPTTNSWWD
jgi:hypothetical protein